MASKSLSSASKDFFASVLCKDFKNSFDLFGERPFQLRVPVISFVLGSLRTFFQGNLFHNIFEWLPPKNDIQSHLQCFLTKIQLDNLKIAGSQLNWRRRDLTIFINYHEVHTILFLTFLWLYFCLDFLFNCDFI